MQIEQFFAYARERQAILLRRRRGDLAPWTTDPILQQYRFCCVFREDDRVTRWFRENVREPMRGSPDVFLATVLFRWFNRISTGEALFSQRSLVTDPSGMTAWEEFGQYGSKRVEILREAIVEYCGAGPYVTGSYIIQGRPGLPKLDGVLSYFEEFCRTAADYPGDVATSRMSWRDVAEMLLANRTWPDPAARFGSLEQTWMWLTQHQGMGPFMAYEVVTDLRHTDLLDWAPDVMTWANPGPGAIRGAGRVFYDDPGRFRGSPQDREEILRLMQILLEASRDAAFWPQPSADRLEYVCSAPWASEFQTWGDWPAWEMREVEHGLCEYLKYTRGYSRNVFRAG